MSISRTSEHIQIKIKMPNPSQEPSASSKAPNEDLRDMDVLCTFKIKIKSKIGNLCASKINDDLQIKIMMPNPTQEPLVSSKAPNQDLRIWIFFGPSNQERDPKIGLWLYQKPVTI